MITGIFLTIVIRLFDILITRSNIRSSRTPHLRKSKRSSGHLRRNFPSRNSMYSLRHMNPAVKNSMNFSRLRSECIRMTLWQTSMPPIQRSSERTTAGLCVIWKRQVIFLRQFMPAALSKSLWMIMMPQGHILKRQ